MPLHSYFVLFAFIILLILFSWQVIRLRSFGVDMLGTPPVEKLYFYSAKIAIFTSWGLFILKAINPGLGYIFFPAPFSWLATIMLYAGIIIFCTAIFNLGKSLKVGIPDHETKLQTRGIYGFSRNPIYVGVHLIGLSSCLYFPDLINIVFTLYGIFIHHKIIAAEEQFLGGRFGTEWTVYCAQVSRYL